MKQVHELKEMKNCCVLFPLLESFNSGSLFPSLLFLEAALILILTVATATIPSSSAWAPTSSTLSNTTIKKKTWVKDLSHYFHSQKGCFYNKVEPVSVRSELLRSDSRVCPMWTACGTPKARSELAHLYQNRSSDPLPPPWHNQRRESGNRKTIV